MNFEGMNILQIVGPKNSGKTTHVEWLISGLKKKGIKVGALKHSVHAHPIDRPGSDSFRMQVAGASPTVFWSAGGLGVFYPEVDQEVGSKLLAKIFTEVDLVVVESFSSANGPKLVIDPEGDQWQQFENVIAIVSEKSLKTHLPVFKKLDPALIDLVIGYFNLS